MSLKLTYEEALKLAEQRGLTDNNIWSVMCGDEPNSVIYGPSHHRINVLGYIISEDPHDGETYVKINEIDEPPKVDRTLYVHWEEEN